MQPDKITLEIATPDRLVLSEDVEEVILPSIEGYFGVRPGHAPLLAQLDVGEISYRAAGQEFQLACSGGFAEIQAGTVSVLATTAEKAEEIDLDRAQLSQKKAEEELSGNPDPDRFAQVELQLKRALSRVRAQAKAH
jgi:F-type H+-transporting ATPase subunit epsilon